MPALKHQKVTGNYKRRAYVTHRAFLVAFYAAEVARPAAVEAADCVGFHSCVHIVVPIAFMSWSFVRLF
jgi:hypothetical protein